ncbi:MAG: chloride channel protein [Methylobacter sp.]
MKQPSPFLSFTAWKQRLVFWLGAIIVGLVIVMMTLLSEWAAQTYRILALQFPWFHFVIPPVGLGFTAWLTFRFFPGSERSGIPQVKTALGIADNLKETAKLISLRIAFGKMFLPIMGLLSGASVGFGGPAVHVGASIMLSLGKVIKFPPHYLERVNPGRQHGRFCRDVQHLFGGYYFFRRHRLCVTKQLHLL